MTYEEALTHSGSLSSLWCPGWGNVSSGEECSRTRRRIERRGCLSPDCGAAAARVGRELVRSAMAPPGGGCANCPARARDLEERVRGSRASILCLILWLVDQPPPAHLFRRQPPWEAGEPRIVDPGRVRKERKAPSLLQPDILNVLYL